MWRFCSLTPCSSIFLSAGAYFVFSSSRLAIVVLLYAADRRLGSDCAELASYFRHVGASFFLLDVCGAKRVDEPRIDEAQGVSLVVQVPVGTELVHRRNSFI